MEEAHGLDSGRVALVAIDSRQLVRIHQHQRPAIACSPKRLVHGIEGPRPEEPFDGDRSSREGRQGVRVAPREGAAEQRRELRELEVDCRSDHRALDADEGAQHDIVASRQSAVSTECHGDESIRDPEGDQD